MIDNDRKHLRFELTVKVRVIDKEGLETLLESQNISENGAFLYCDKSLIPNIGEIIVVQLMRKLDGAGTAKVNAVIVRVNEKGFGIEFLSELEE